MAAKKPIPELTEKDKERFLSKVTQKDAGDCWPWTGRGTAQGYGFFDYGGGTFISTRVAWMIFFGQDPGSLNVLHSCDNPPCCNPSHLWLGTHSENTKDMVAKGRRNHAKGERNGTHTKPENVPKGESHYMGKLNDEKVREIRATIGITTLAEMAAKFGVDMTLISLVRRGKSWKHVV